MSAAHWHIGISCSLFNWYQLIIGQIMSAAHCPTIATCSLANCCCQLLNGQPISAAHWSTNISCSLSKWCQLLIGHLTSAAHWLTNISCSFANWCQLLIGQLTSAPHLSTDISCFAQVLLSTHWLTVVVSCLTANQSAVYWSFDISCSLSKWY